MKLTPFEGKSKERETRIKTMGYLFLAFAIAVSGATHLLPDNDSVYWFSTLGKKGFYVLSSFIAFLGFYCLGAVWRPGHSNRNYRQ